MKRFFALLLSVCLICALGVTAFAADGDIVILYTNDVHTYIYDEPETDDSGAELPREYLSYDSIAALKKELGENVLLVDAGDHIQGSAYGAMDNGKTIIELMNAAGYDAATLGNHEFDYGMARALEIVGGEAKFPYLSCNFMDLTKNETLLDSYKIFEVAGKKVAIVGVTTPETITKSAPAYFQDGNGNFIYGIEGGEDGKALYTAVQTAIDAAKAEGADIVIGLGHLGIDETSKPWTSRDVIANTCGFNAFIDGHSHSTVEGEEVKDKDGHTVILTQTGNYFDTIGKMTIAADGTVSTELVSVYAELEASASDIITKWVGEVDGQLGQKIATSDIDFRITNADDARLIRVMETNLGDFNADAFYYYINGIENIDCDVAIMNGGGIRANADKGDWTYKTMKSVNTFGNILCLMEVTGQQILDALEWGAKSTTNVPAENENGGFLHVAGITYDINTDVESTVQANEDGIWTGGPTGTYRVRNVQVYNKETGAYEPLDLKAKYNLAGTNYTLRSLGDGFNMFDGAVLVKDYIAEDYLALSAYAKAFKNSTVNTANSPLASYANYKINYESINGAGRIAIYDNTTAPDNGADLSSAVAVFAVMLVLAGAVTVYEVKRSRAK